MTKLDPRRGWEVTLRVTFTTDDFDAVRAAAQALDPAGAGRCAAAQQHEVRFET
jgi:hypothetical protein